jgi:tetratricopeptide (TPR) repeat protein
MMIARVAVFILSLWPLAGTTAVAASPKNDAPIAWERDLKKALAKASTAQKPVVVDFWAEWCHWCHELDENTYSDPEVATLARDFVAVKVDTEGTSAEQGATAKYLVETLPTIAFLTPQGRLFYRVDGFQNADQFTATLEKVRAMAKDVLGWDESLAQNKTDAAALASLGRHLFDQEIFEESRDLLERARKADTARPLPERKHTRTMLGIIQFYDKKYGDSERLLKEALALAPPDAAEDATAHFALGKTYARWGKRDLARAAFEKAQATQPEGPLIEKIRAELEKIPDR